MNFFLVTVSRQPTTTKKLSVYIVVLLFIKKNEILNWIITSLILSNQSAIKLFYTIYIISKFVRKVRFCCKSHLTCHTALLIIQNYSKPTSQSFFIPPIKLTLPIENFKQWRLCFPSASFGCFSLTVHRVHFDTLWQWSFFSPIYHQISKYSLFKLEFIYLLLLFWIFNENFLLLLIFSKFFSSLFDAPLVIKLVLCPHWKILNKLCFAHFLCLPAAPYSWWSFAIQL